MFGPPDLVPVECRNRVFNAKILPLMNEMKIKKKTDGFWACCLEFDLSTEELTQPVYAETYARVKDELGRHGLRPDRMLAESDDETMLLCVVFVAPRGTPHHSAWRIDLGQADLPIEMDTEYRFNSFFSNRILWDTFRRLNPAALRAARHMPGNYLCLVRNENRNVWQYGHISFDEWERACRLSFVPRSVMEYISQARDRPAIVFDVINYTLDYFLVIEFDDRGRFRPLKFAPDPSLSTEDLEWWAPEN